MDQDTADDEAHAAGRFHNAFIHHALPFHPIYKAMKKSISTYAVEEIISSEFLIYILFFVCSVYLLDLQPD